MHRPSPLYPSLRLSTPLTCPLSHPPSSPCQEGALILTYAYVAPFFVSAAFQMITQAQRGKHIYTHIYTYMHIHIARLEL